MMDALDRLRASLADRYAIEREVGHGGMATVYLAEDRKHQRPVAIKVLDPELARALGAERFLREVDITAKLNHPHILPLLDSGSAEESTTAQPPDRPSAFLYYVMPYVEGETLRERLTREGQLPLDDALRITREVAAALSYAHSQGVVHRDIKPENVLLSAGEAVVADFGIARAITQAGGEQLTETGISVGTPAYMSPEQAAGEQRLDGRSDLYSLGCVLYEMLAGEPPYTGPTAQAIVAKKLSEAVPRVSVVRERVPPAVEAAIERALAKAPADRFATAQQFTEALAADGVTLARQVPRAPRVRRLAIGGVALIVAAVGVWAVALRPSRSDDTRPAAIPLDSTAIAVLPFQVVGADSGSAARTLARFMGDLFELKVTGEFGRHIRHPGSVAERWRAAGGTLDSAISEEAEVSVARGVGAGRLVRGTVVVRGDSLTVSASMTDAATGALRVTPVVVRGTIGGQEELVDRLIILLMAQECGCYTPATAPELVRYKPEAIQALLAAYAAPDLSSEKTALFHAALRADSSLIDAALASYISGEEDTVALRYAWEHQEQLPERSRAYLQVLAAPRYGTIRTVPDRIAGYEALTRRWPEWGLPWSDIGQHLLKYGSLASIPDWRRRARDAFEHLSDRDAYNSWQLAELAFVEQDTVRARAAIDRLAVNADASGGFYAQLVPAYRWRLATLEGDTVDARRNLALAGSVLVPLFAYVDGRGFTDADRLGSRLEHDDYAAQGAWARGRERAWVDGLRRQASSAGGTIRIAEPVFYALLLGPSADSVASEAVRSLESVVRADVMPPPSPDEQALARAWLTLWRVRHGDTTGARAARRYLERDENQRFRFAAWARLIDVLLVEAEGGDVRAALLRMDSVVRTLPLSLEQDRWSPMSVEVQNLWLARMLRLNGEPDLALAAARRRPYYAFLLGAYNAFPEYLREEGRLAALTGDSAGAIKAYQHYLALREDPDRPWRVQWDSVKVELAALVAR